VRSAECGVRSGGPKVGNAEGGVRSGGQALRSAECGGRNRNVARLGNLARVSVLLRILELTINCANWHSRAAWSWGKLRTRTISSGSRATGAPGTDSVLASPPAKSSALVVPAEIPVGSPTRAASVEFTDGQNRFSLQLVC